MNTLNKNVKNSEVLHHFDILYDELFREKTAWQSDHDEHAMKHIKLQACEILQIIQFAL